MVNVAKIQSTKSSNAIEGIYTSNSRLKKLINNKIEPQNKDEQEIAGYRNIIDIAHENYEHIDFTKNNILALHNQLYSYSSAKFKGKFKGLDNKIIEPDALATKETRFKPVSSFETENYIDKMIEAYNEAVRNNIPPLIFIPMLILDFLCIHPFDDGNGRMSRILTLLLLYKFGYFVGKYISIEMLIEQTNDSYYETLKQSSQNWHSNENDTLPFIKYVLGIVLMW